MNLLSEAMGGMGAALLPVVAGLLLEELTVGGLVRLLVVPRTPNKDAVRGESKFSQRDTGAKHNRESGVGK